LRAIAQGPTSAPTVKSNPFNPKAQRDELGETWSVWNPRSSAFPLTRATLTSRNSSKTFTWTVKSRSDCEQRDGVGHPDRGTETRPEKRAGGAARRSSHRGANRGGAKFVNEISGSTRMLCHGLLYVGKGNLEWVQEQTDKNEPDSWKGYNISNAAKVDNDPNSLIAAMAARMTKKWRIPHSS